MGKRKGFSLVGAFIILSISIIIAAFSLSNAIRGSGYNISNQLNSHYVNYNSNENFEPV